MSLILNIDTSSENASICIARNGDSIAMLENGQQKDHAAWIHPAIKLILKQVQISVQNLNAVAVAAGPGSYTGLRVGMSTAKGLCYALNIPLITENTLRVMALAAKQVIEDRVDMKNILISPMLDARRMEVFTALFREDLQEVLPSCALILDSDTFSEYLLKSEIFFSGNGSTKFRPFVTHDHAIFSEVHHSAVHLATLSNKKFVAKQFDDIAYTEPLYLKEFYTVPKK